MKEQDVLSQLKLRLGYGLVGNQNIDDFAFYTLYDAKLEDGKVTLDVVITVEYGMVIPDVCTKVQENVKNTVETMTGLEVSQVNIQVQEISFKKEKEEKEQRRI